jgi:hypothetical protein
MNGVWTGTGHCPVEECVFMISIRAETESDLDLSAMAAFDAHCAREHPGLPLSLQAYRRMDDVPPKLMN